MQSISIIVEGKADEKFLSDFVRTRFGTSETDRVKFIIVDGKAEKLNLAKQLIQASTYSERVNLLIFDGDDNNVVETEEKIHDKAHELDLVFNNTFLFPDNATQGNLEVVLRNI